MNHAQTTGRDVASFPGEEFSDSGLAKYLERAAAAVDPKTIFVSIPPHGARNPLMAPEHFSQRLPIGIQSRDRSLLPSGCIFYESVNGPPGFFFDGEEKTFSRA